MKLRAIVFIILSNIAFVLHSQFSVSITANNGSACIDSSIQFIAQAINDGDTISGVTFRWSFGDGSISKSGVDLDTITHKFKKGQGYIIRVDAEKETLSDYDLKQFNIALKPNFEGTKSDREEPICLGQQIFLTGKIKDTAWQYTDLYERIENEAIVISESKAFSSLFDYRSFKKTEVITDGSEIDTVGIMLEHTDISHLKIELIAPNGVSLLLKDFGGSAGKDFGQPNTSEPGKPGIAYYYYWTNNPQFGQMNMTNPTGDALQQGTYEPEQAFSTLTNCPLNGEWTIKLTDNNTASSGFAFATKLVIKGEHFFDSWAYQNSYSFPEWVGSGVSSTSEIGLATAIPNAHGNHRYTYKVTDNFGCPSDTSIINNVEAATFVTTPDSAAGPFDLIVKFENTTSWAELYEWDFGDRSEISFEESPEHVYTKHGEYIAFMKVKTEDGCMDTTSIIVKVTIPKSSLDEIPNAFSPNDDGKNDIFKLQKGTAIRELNAYIYSRWGKKVAEWHSIEDAVERGWDGRVKGGGRAAPGVYYYIIKAVGFDDQVYEKKGAFHLFR